jgi:pimeloyl-ACP methyl ester carboxylesterase
MFSVDSVFRMADPLPVVLVPGLLCSARLYGPQLPALWRFGPVTIADHRRDDDITAVARRILDAAPPRFALAGLSYGGYIAFAMHRLAPERIARLALLDTMARPDTEEARTGREKLMSQARAGKFEEVVDLLTTKFLHVNREHDEHLVKVVRDMAAETGVEAFVRQQRSIMQRPDARSQLASIKCPTVVLTGDSDVLTPPNLAKEMAEGITGSRLVIVPDCGHLSTLERPDAVNTALIAWLQG